MVKYYLSKSEFSTEQSIRSPQKYQHENRSEMADKSSSVQGSQRKNYDKISFGASAQAYVMKAKEDADLPEVIIGNLSFL